MTAWAELARRARAQTGLTQRAFSAAIGASRATVAAWEAGLREPSPLSISLLCLIELMGNKAIAHLLSCHEKVGRE